MKEAPMTHHRSTSSERLRVLEAAQIEKTFTEGRHQVTVLRGISLDVAAGEIVALEGPSGSGKTTLLSIVGCILSPTAGRVVINGDEIDMSRESSLRAARRSRIGFVFQQYNLFPSLTARENVEYSLNVRGWRGSAARNEAVRALSEVELSDRLDFLPRDLSGGQKQRVAIARALAGRPPLLLADEPTANLDSEVGGQILHLFQELARHNGTGVLIVTHDPRVRGIADRAIGIRDGLLTRNAMTQLEVPAFSASDPEELDHMTGDNDNMAAMAGGER